MDFKKYFPYSIAGFVTAAGVFFCVSVFIDGALVDTEPPGSHFLAGIAIIFIGAGVYYLYSLTQGKLEESRKSIAEVRQEAIAKMKDPGLLTRIASGDEIPEIRDAARERLEELRA